MDTQRNLYKDSQCERHYKMQKEENYRFFYGVGWNKTIDIKCMLISDIFLFYF